MPEAMAGDSAPQFLGLRGGGEEQNQAGEARANRPPKARQFCPNGLRDCGRVSGECSAVMRRNRRNPAYAIMGRSGSTLGMVL